MEIKVGNRFHLLRRVGAGSYGEVFLGEDIETKQKVAVKMEQNKTQSPQLHYEAKLYNIFSSGVSIPRFYWYGNEAKYRVMVIEYLGKSLEDLFQLCHQRFSVKTVLMIADQAISALEFIHIRRFIHRDIKPDNFMIGTGNKKNKLFVIDFGLSKRYRDLKTDVHINYVEGKTLTGTARYASINALKGCEQSRRDDLEALGYCLLYFLRGSLPWMGLPGKNRKEKYEKICSVKAETKLEDLCKGFPPEFQAFLKMVRSLDFTQEPEYSKYRKMFRDCLIREGYVYDYQYDWVNLSAVEGARHARQQSKNSSLNFFSIHTRETNTTGKESNEENALPVNKQNEGETFQPTIQQKSKTTTKIKKPPIPSQPLSNNSQANSQSAAQLAKKQNSSRKNPLMGGKNAGTTGQVHCTAIPSSWSKPKTLSGK